MLIVWTRGCGPWGRSVGHVRSFLPAQGRELQRLSLPWWSYCMLVLQLLSLITAHVIRICSGFLPPPRLCLPEFLYWAWLWSSRETPRQTIGAFCTLQKAPDASRAHIKFVTNFKLGMADHVAATSSVEAGGFSPTATTTTIQTKHMEQQLPVYYWQQMFRKGTFKNNPV